MAKIITTRSITQAIPQPAAGVFVSARYEISPEIIDTLSNDTVNEIVRTLEFSQFIRRAISDSVGREYKRSGLRIITRQLFRNATENFNIEVFVSGNVLEIIARWLDPTIPYFFIHLFGGKAGVNDSVTIPRRNFIKLDGSASTIIAGEITREFSDALANIAGLEKARELGGRRQRVAERSARELDRRRGARISRQFLRGRRQTPFRVRREIRRAGIPEGVARQVEPRVSAAIERGLDVTALIEGLRIGLGVTAIQTPEIRLVGGRSPILRTRRTFTRSLPAQRFGS